MSSKKLTIPCPKCGREVIKKRLIPLYKKQSQLIAVAKEPLQNYEYTCPYCKTVSVYDKDYVREVWEQDNPSKLTARKL